MSFTFFSRRNVLLIVATVFVVIVALLSLRMRNGNGTGGDFVEYQMIVANDIPTTVAVAPDNTVWFTIGFADAIGFIRNGKLQRLPKGKKSVEPTGLGVDADGAAWFTDPTEVLISRILPSGDIKSFPLGTPIARLGRLAVAPDGAVWFAESTTYGFTRLKDGVLTRNVPRSVRGGPYGVAVDTRGDVWGTLQSGNQLVKISQGKEIAEYEIPTPGSSPSDVAADNAGNIWVLEFRSNKIAKFSSGKFLEFVVPGEWSGLSGIAAAADGAVWFGLLRNHSIGRLRNGEFKIFQLPRKDARPYTLAIDKDSNVWYADISGYVGMLKADAASR